MRPSRTIAPLFFLSLLAGTLAASAQNSPSPDIGPKVGDRVPQFKLRDQFDHEQTPESLKGKNGTVLVFFRSADW